MGDRARVSSLLVALALVGGCKKPEPPPPPPWTVTAREVEGASWCAASGDRCAPAADGAAHEAVGAVLKTGSGGRAVVTVDESTRVELGPDATIAFEEPHVVVARAGVVVVRRTPPSAPAPATLRLGEHGAELDARVPTTASVHAFDDGARASVSVEHGVVRFDAGPHATELRAGDTVSVAKGADVDRRGEYLGTVRRVEVPVREQALDRKVVRGLGTMTARVPGTEQVVAGVRLLAHHVRAVIQNGFARTEVEEVFANDGERTLEGRYVFAVPPRAVTARLALWVGEKLVEDEVVERKRAAAIFKDVVDDTVRPRDPALLEWVASGELSLKVFPIPAKGTRKVVLAYDEVLDTSGGDARYVYPMSLGEARSNTIDDLSVSVTVTEPDGPPADARASGYPATLAYDGGALAASFSAKAFAPTADFVVSWRRPKPGVAEGAAFVPSRATPSELGLDRTAKAAGDDSFGAMRLTVGLPAGVPPPAFRRRDRIVVIGTSRSQSKETLEAEVRVATAMVRALEPDEKLALLACDSACSSYPPKGLAPATAASFDAADAWSKALAPAGSSDVGGALLAASALAPEGGDAQIVFVGDGAATSGELTTGRIAARVKPRLEKKKIDLRFVGAGATVDAAALIDLARELGATYQPLTTGDPFARRIDDLATSLRRPVVRSPRLKAPDTMSDVYPTSLPNLVIGEQLLVFGKLSGTAAGTAELSGEVDGAPWTSTYPVSWGSTPAHQATLVPRFWAARKIDELVLLHEPKADQEAVALSKRFHVLSRLTSMLVLENDAMFAAYGVKRSVAPDGSTQPAERSAALAKQVEQVRMQMLAALGGSPAGGSGGDLHAGSSGLVFGPGSSTIGGASAGIERQVSGPRGDAQVGGIATTVPIANAQRIVAGLRPRMRACYNRGLASDPSMSGRLVVVAKILPDGEVSSAEIASNSGLSQSVGACIVSVVRRAQFDAPGGQGSALQLPVVFQITESGAAPAPMPMRAYAPPPPEPSATTRPSDDAWRSAGEDALAKLRAASTASPESRAKREALLRGLLVRGRFEEALGSARAFADADPDFPGALDLLSYAAAASGDANAALLAVDAVVEASARSVKAHVRAARAFEAAADERRACAHWRSLVELEPTQDEWRYQAIRCRARVLDDAEGAKADAAAVEKPSKRLTALRDLLAAAGAAIPAYDPAGAWAGQMEVTVKCDGPAEACPIPIVVAPNGTVFSPYTPADARSGPRGVAVTVVRDGTYHTMVVGGGNDVKATVAVRAADSSRTFELSRGGLQSVAASDVQVPTAWIGSIGSLARMMW